jgi:uncharacterized protein (TIGR02145 family)
MNRCLVICTALFLLSSFTLDAQVHIIYSGDSAVLVTQSMLHGTVQWQSSPDQLNWTDVPGWNHDSLYFWPPDSLTWYRASIFSGTCNPVFSNPQGVRKFLCGDTITDGRDGRKYPTVQIGNQCWMSRNINVGTMIDGALSMANDSLIQKYCYDNDSSNCNTYGAMYQWDELMNYSIVPGSQGICPTGFHVPTDNEILSLEIFLGMDPGVAALMNTWRGTDEGTKLKQGGTSGFNANLSGVRYDGGLFYSKGTFEYIYTSDTYPFNNLLALRRCLNLSDPTIGRFYNTTKTIGGSLRCLKNP